MPPPPELCDAVKRAKLRWTDADYRSAFNWLAHMMPVVPSDSTNAHNARDAIDKLYLALHDVPGLSVDRVHKGGSLGRNTLVAGDFDVDLLVFVNKPLEPLQDWSAAAMSQLRAKLRDWRRKNAFPEIKEEDGTQYDDVLQVIIGSVQMDVLLVPNVAQAAGSGVEKAELQREILLLPILADPSSYQRDQTREAALAESHTAFMKGQPDMVKADVRLMKAWYKYGGLQPAASRTGLKVPSVALELLVVAAHQKVATQRRQAAGSKPLRTFIRALELLDAAAGQDRTVITVDASPWGCTRDQALQFQHVWGTDLVRIIHPIDPTCNVARPRRGTNADWAGLAAAGRHLVGTIQQGTLDDLVSSPTLGRALRELATIKRKALPW